MQVRTALTVLVRKSLSLVPQGSLSILQSADFLQKSSERLRSETDRANLIASDPRLAALVGQRELGRFWSVQATPEAAGADLATESESAIRTFLREGWSIAPKQPEALLPCAEICNHICNHICCRAPRSVTTSVTTAAAVRRDRGLA